MPDEILEQVHGRVQSMTVEQVAEPGAVTRPASPVPFEAGSWLLILVPVIICLGMLAFMAFASA